MNEALLDRILGWALVLANVIFVVLVARRKPRATMSRSRSGRTVLTGVVLQTLSYPAAWIFRRRADVPSLAVALISLLAAWGSVLAFARLKKRLGRLWALGARVVEGHELITDGPFRRVRHPIYLSMLGLLAADILGVSSPAGAALALAAFAAGTALRTRAEDALLAETFGAEFEEYRRRVPAFIPRLR
jgi:protein-S-isoprenylcysteine O-methyltransferase Ste14